MEIDCVSISSIAYEELLDFCVLSRVGIMFEPLNRLLLSYDYHAGPPCLDLRNHAEPPGLKLAILDHGLRVNFPVPRLGLAEGEIALIDSGLSRQIR
jgi:hypothetical protein